MTLGDISLKLTFFAFLHFQTQNGLLPTWIADAFKYASKRQ